MGELVDAVRAFSEPITKLIDVASRGIGTLYEPTKIRKLARAKGVEISAIAQVLRENEDLPIFYDKGGIQIDSTDVRTLAERASSRLILQEMRKQQNIEAIVDKAYEELQNETEVSSEPIDDDWIVRFFNSVADVSNEKLREIWGKILAGEIRKPGNSSFRTLDTLRNISFSEACLIEKLAICVLYFGENVVIPRYQSLLRLFDIETQDLLLLYDAGIINLTNLGLGLPEGATQESIRNNQIAGVISMTLETARTFKIDVYSITETGKEILSIISPAIERSALFALEFFKGLKNTKKECRVQAFRITNLLSSAVECDAQDLLQ